MTYAADSADATEWPEEASADVLALIAKQRGKEALAEVRECLAVIDGEIREHAEQVGLDNQQPQYHLRSVIDRIDRRRVYQARLDALRRILKEGGKAAEPPPPVFEGLAGILAENAAAIRPALTAAIQASKHELAAVDRQVHDLAHMLDHPVAYPACRQLNHALDTGMLNVRIQALEAEKRALLQQKMNPVPRPPTKYLCPMDHMISKLNPLFERKHELAARIVRQEGDRARAAELQADLVTGAVKQAGGLDQVVLGILAAEVIGGGATPPALQPIRDRIHKLEAAMFRTSATLEDLKAGGAGDSQVAKVLKQSLDTAAAELAAARKELAAGHRRLSVDLVEAAMEGKEAARARLQALVEAAPQAFPATFPEAIRSARFEVAAIQELRRTLSTAASARAG